MAAAKDGKEGEEVVGGTPLLLLLLLLLLPFVASPVVFCFFLFLCPPRFRFLAWAGIASVVTAVGLLVVACPVVPSGRMTLPFGSLPAPTAAPTGAAAAAGRFLL